LTFFIVLLIATGAAFAQEAEEPKAVPDGLSFTGWGRADFVPFQGVFVKDKDPVFTAGVGSGWGPAYTGISIRFSAADGRVGGGADLSRGTGGPSDGDEVNIWAKPFGSDILEIKVGQTRDGRFRGPGTDDNFQNFIGEPGKDGDAVFNRFEPDFGALFVSKPTESLSIFALLDAGKDMTNITGGITGSEAKDVYKRIQAGAAYDFSGIGLARLQWVGNSLNAKPAKLNYTKFDLTAWQQAGADVSELDNPTSKFLIPVDAEKSDTFYPARFEAAFQLKAIEGLTLDLGVKIPIPVEDEGTDKTYQDSFKVAAAGDFKSGDFGIAYGLYGAFGGKTKNPSGVDDYKWRPTFDLIVVPSFYVAALDATVGADVGLRVEGKSSSGGTKNKDQSATIGFGGWISRDLGKGSIKTGLAYQLPPLKEDTKGATSYFSWPIILEVSF
jgi:hypothetical protein